jgi:hypothetical protein
MAQGPRVNVGGFEYGGGDESAQSCVAPPVTTLLASNAPVARQAYSACPAPSSSRRPSACPPALCHWYHRRWYHCCRRVSVLVDDVDQRGVMMFAAVAEGCRADRGVAQSAHRAWCWRCGLFARRADPGRRSCRYFLERRQVPWRNAVDERSVQVDENGPAAKRRTGYRAASCCWIAAANGYATVPVSAYSNSAIGISGGGEPARRVL